jgi:hypothetical protein
VSSDLSALVGAAQASAAALDGGYELREVELERVEDLVGVVLGAQPDLALPAARALDDLLAARSAWRMSSCRETSSAWRSGASSAIRSASRLASANRSSRS